MTANKITLTWNEFDSSASSTIQQLWLDQEFTDVTLVTEDERQFKAHKVVLVSSSLFCKSLFRAFPHPSPLLFLAGVNSEQLQLLLEFMYLGRCQVAKALFDLPSANRYNILSKLIFCKTISIFSWISISMLIFLAVPRQLNRFNCLLVGRAPSPSWPCWQL